MRVPGPWPAPVGNAHLIYWTSLTGHPMRQHRMREWIRRVESQCDPILVFDPEVVLGFPEFQEVRPSNMGVDVGREHAFGRGRVDVETLDQRSRGIRDGVGRSYYQ